LILSYTTTRARVEKPNQGVPSAWPRAVLRRDGVFQQLGLDGLEQAVHVALVQAGGVDQQDHVGGRGGAFGLQAGQDAGVVGVHAVDLDAGGLGEVVVQRLVGRVVAGRVQVQHLLLRGCGVPAGDEQRREATALES
jgi:hypothetical protein